MKNCLYLIYSRVSIAFRLHLRSVIHTKATQLVLEASLLAFDLLENMGHSRVNQTYVVLEMEKQESFPSETHE